jgi:hypothetical protein
MYKLSLWYEEQAHSNGALQEDDNYGGIYSQQILPSKLNRHSVFFEKKIIHKDTIDYNCLNLFVVEIKYVKQFQGALSSLSQSVLDFVRNNKLKIVFHYAKEGYEIDQDIVSLYSELKAANLLHCDAFLIFGDQDIEMNYRKARTKYSLPDFFTKVFPINFFESHYLDTLDDLDENYIDNLPKDNQKNKDFLFYNGKIRIHRLLAHKEIIKRGLDKDGLISFIGDTHVETEQPLDFYRETLNALGLLDTDMQNYLNSWQPISLDKKGSEFTYYNQNKTVNNHYRDTRLSLVSEMSITTRFLTEKIYKPILNRHPFLVIGGEGILETLQNDGYYTFPEIFNEDYDGEPDPKRRVFKVIDELERFCSLTDREKENKIKQVEFKIDYNKKHFLERASTSMRDQYTSILENIYES